MALFRAMSRDRPNHVILVALLAAGYMGVWVAFGVAVHLADLAVHDTADQSSWLSANGWVTGTGTLLVPGVY